MHALGWTADGSPEDGSLRQFAVGAVVQHLTKTMNRVEGVDFRLPTDAELDALEAFQRSLGRQREVDIAALTFLDDAAQRGKDLFEGVGINRSCTACHANAGSNVLDDVRSQTLSSTTTSIPAPGSSALALRRAVSARITRLACPASAMGRSIRRR